MFQVGARYENRREHYVVLAINGPRMTVRCDDGTTKTLSVEIAWRIWENLCREREGDTAGAPTLNSPANAVSNDGPKTEGDGGPRIGVAGQTDGRLPSPATSARETARSSYASLVILSGVAAIVLWSLVSAPMLTPWIVAGAVALWLLGRRQAGATAGTNGVPPHLTSRPAQGMGAIPAYRSPRPRAAVRSSSPYVNHCWQCRSSVRSGMNAACPACNWLICACGACRAPEYGGCSRGA
jgi:hypothetical protein